MAEPPLEIHVNTADGYVLPTRTAAALEALAEAVAADADLDDEDEVSGFANLRVGGSLEQRIGQPGPLQFCFPMYSSTVGTDGDKAGGSESCFGIFV